MIVNKLQDYFGELRPGDYVIPKHGREDQFVRRRPLLTVASSLVDNDEDREDREAFLNRMIPRRIKEIFFRQPLYRMKLMRVRDDNGQEHFTYDYQVVEWKLSQKFPDQHALYASMCLEKKNEIVHNWLGDMNTDPIVIFDRDDDFQDQTTNDLWAKNYMKAPAQNIYRPNLAARETGVARSGI